MKMDDAIIRSMSELRKAYNELYEVVNDDDEGYGTDNGTNAVNYLELAVHNLLSEYDSLCGTEEAVMPEDNTKGYTIREMGEELHKEMLEGEDGVGWDHVIQRLSAATADMRESSVSTSVADRLADVCEEFLAWNEHQENQEGHTNEVIYSKISAHIGHTVEIAQYASLVNVSVECIDCGQVVIDADKPEEDSA